jgi:uncharacterized membrane protein YdbT with pleckstrin-like domain
MPHTLPAAASLTDAESRQVLAISRPHQNLLIYYALGSLLAGPFFPVALVVLYFRYHTMRYRFDDHGVNMRWGILFRREVSLSYARIQDIHLTSNFVERWLGLAQVKLSTASGSAGAEMTIEGLQEFELVRDFLYARMRGFHDQEPKAADAPPAEGAEPAGSLSAVTAALREATEELRAVRAAVEAQMASRRD